MHKERNPQVLRGHHDPAAIVIVRQVLSDGVPLHHIGYMFEDDEVPLLLIGEQLLDGLGGIACLARRRSHEEELSEQGVEEGVRVERTRHSSPRRGL